MKKRTAAIIVLVVLAGVLLVLTPAEANLGYTLRIVYLHAAIAENGVLFFVIAAVMSMAGLRRRAQASLARPFFMTGLGLWIVQGMLGTVNMRIIWGAMLWGTPKVRMSLLVLLGGLATYLITELVASRFVETAAVLATGALAVWASFFTPRIYHPVNPIFGGESAALKVTFVALFALVFLIGFLIAVGERERLAGRAG